MNNGGSRIYLKGLSKTNSISCEFKGMQLERETTPVHALKIHASPCLVGAWVQSPQKLNGFCSPEIDLCWSDT
jgi:hypothetical protein